MSVQLPVAATLPCIWMEAGILRYKLCTRGFDCEHCLLDLALRGNGHDGHLHSALAGWGSDHEPPQDRLYSSGHTWVRAAAELPRVWRVGVDGFAAALIDRASAVCSPRPERVVERGEPVCEIDIGDGLLPIGAPLRGRVVRGNDELSASPGAVLSDPYERGWLLEIAASDPVGLRALATPGAERRRASLDLRRFRRAVAIHLLADGDESSEVEQTPTEHRLTSLRVLLGTPAYVELLREFIH